MSAIKMALRQSQRNGRRKTSEDVSGEVSPDSKCPICLDKFTNVAHLDICRHKFCFRCIHEWSKNKAECPLCKQPFNSIFHSVKSDQDYKQYYLKPLDNGSFQTFGGGIIDSYGNIRRARFRYRTTLTGGHRQLPSRTSLPPDNGVMFESSANASEQHMDRYLRHRMMRLAAARRAERDGAVPNVREQEMIDFRRELYRRGVRVRSVRDSGRSRDTSADFYRRNPACLHRLIPWLKRELVALYGAHGSLVNIVQSVIMSRITRYGIVDGSIQEELTPFLQGRTEHFLHEFISFAKSPFNMEAYDQFAAYDLPAPSSNEDGSANSSVIAISEDDPNSVELDPSGDSMSTLSHSLWDDETPGPSYSTTVEQSRTERLSVLDLDSDSSVENDMRESGASPQPTSPRVQTDPIPVKVNNDDSDSDDCLIVGFVKPTTDRTPELVQLSSDSSEDSANEDTKDVPLLPQHMRFNSLSPQYSHQGDPGERRQSENAARKSISKDRRRSSSSSRSRTSNRSERKNRRHHDGRYHRHSSRERQRSRNRDQRRRSSRRRRRSKSRDHRRSSRSPLASHRGGSSLTRDKKHLYSSSRGRHPDFRHNPPAYSHHLESYSHYNQKRRDAGTYTEERSYYHSSHNYSVRYSYSHSRSHSRESRQRDGVLRYSRSRTNSSSCSPSSKRSHTDKPGGKRKYKTRHLEDSSKKSPSKVHSEADSSTSTKHRKRSKEKRLKKSKESRSLSVEIVNEEKRRHHKKKKKHKKKSKRHKSKERTEKPPPGVITIDSDSDANGGVARASSTNENDLISSTTDAPADSNPLQSLL
ncbi:topoisomerase I binding, arginine/serine-rich a [Genypterus blacodes]|uniref:topoisomerase I binding, arginine/serine-rich a n=1 Tax=Genypterus blacodes TaxID=154954 RepID=UPI003F7723E2